MMGQWVFIEAEDVWMFRDAKPFTAQQAFNATSQFPPNPQTIQGVIRSHYLEAQGVVWDNYPQRYANLYEQVGDHTSLGKLRIKGPFVARQVNGTVELCVPAPLDVVSYQDTEDKNKKLVYKLLKLDRETYFHTDGVPKGWIPLIAPADYKHRAGWMTQAQFEAYLQGAEPKALQSVGDIWQPEPRIGLALDYGKRANKESYLYRATFVRPREGVGVLVHVNDKLFSDNGLLRIGGESRMGRYSVINNFTMPQPIAKTGNLKVVMMTPAYFSDGWQPAGGSWSHWVGGGKLVSAVIGKPLAISGWDVANNRAKPLRHYVPVGSVYYFENAEWQDKPFTESPVGEAEFDQMGFGCVAVGTYK